jgi:2-polyprenyl-6-methoxyphenol hydroxylase-like FAD-dependent oxidoreductase
MLRSDPEIAVVGGGICGLTTALALERRGFDPTVYEAAAAYRPVGAGILLQTNALLVLDRLGVADRVRDAGVPLTESLIRSPSGSILQRLDLDGVERAEFGYGHVAVHRATLLDSLRTALDTTVETGMRCRDVAETAPATVIFEDGTRVRPDVLVGADGIHSTVRDAVVPGVDPRPLDAVVYRALVDVALPDRHRDRGVEVWGDGSYAGGAPVGDDRFYWFGTAPDPVPAAGADPAARMAALRERFGRFPAPIPTVLDHADPAAVIVTELEDVPTLDRWSRGSVVLAGDAAHGMLPFAGQGAAQGIEDGLALAHAIDTHEVPTAAFDAYATERQARAERVRDEARRLGMLGTLQSRLATRARNLAVRAVPNRLFQRFRRQRTVGTSLPDPGSLGGIETV